MLVVLYNVYAMCILFWHFRRYVIIRHSYLTRGVSPHGGRMGSAWGWVGARRRARLRRRRLRLCLAASAEPHPSVLNPFALSAPPPPPPQKQDDPNFWLALTHQADAKSITKRVRKMLLDLNLASEGGGPVGARGPRACAVHCAPLARSCAAAGARALQRSCQWLAAV